MRSYVFVVAAIAFASLVGQSALADPLDASAFSYAPVPLAVTATSTKVTDGVRSALVTFQSGPRTIHAEIVAPSAASAPGPGVLFVHWLGEAKSTNHTEFESDAVALAKRGATSVLLDAMWSTVTTSGVDWFAKVREPSSDYAASIGQVIDLRRSLDLLTAQPNVDPSSIAYVGHDFGSMYGAVLAGVDPRPRYYVLMAGTTTFAQWYLLGAQPADVAGYTRQMSALDPLQYLRRSKAQGFLFQFVSSQNALAFFGAAPLPRGMFVYDAGHDLATPGAFIDRQTWLTSRLFR
jgi:hypothetical protein